MFDKIETLNASLQNSDLCVNAGHENVNTVINILSKDRDSKFTKLWEKANADINVLGLEDPKLKRQKKIPKRLEQTSIENTAHIFKTPKEYYKKIFLEIFDQVLMSLNTRFSSETKQLLNTLENFLTKKSEDTETIFNFYNNSMPKNATTPSDGDLDEEKLLRHRELFFDILSDKSVNVNTFKDVVTFLRENKTIRDFLPEYNNLVKLLLTIPNSTCTCERSFSAMRRLKTYLRNSMGQRRLNNVAILHVHKDDASNLDLEALMNKFISKNTLRASIFAISHETQ